MAFYQESITDIYPKHILMTVHKVDVLIIGGGLSGLSLAYFLQKSGINSTILEARERLGGRMLTQYEAGKAPLEMGATWLGNKHTALTTLLKELELEIFEQYLGEQAIYEPISTSPPQLVTLPVNEEPSYRIVGGSSQLIQTLHQQIKNTQEIHTATPVVAIKEKGDVLEVHTKEGMFTSSVVVSTVPPNLLAKSVTFEPSLPKDILTVMKTTHTWMGDSIKIALTYEEPFWRDHGHSGTIFSGVGPIPEMYDHSDVADQTFGLCGFLNGSYFSLEKEERLSLILGQLKKYFGSQAEDFLSYEERVWRNEPFTYTPYEAHVLPHQHNGHFLYRSPYYHGKLFLSGTETAHTFPGYMDGAVRSAQQVASVVQANYQHV
ncbi:MAG: NAD(P)/FAD-dependent oxidoreductase [Bacteroidota bacterium]